MIRGIGFFARLAVVVAVALWLVNQPGTASLAWHGYIVQTSAALLAVAFVLAAYALFQVFRLASAFVQGPRFWRLRQNIRRLEKGQALISQGIVALAGGDFAEAGKLAVSARKLLGSCVTTRWLQAQAAMQAGDHRAAIELFRALACDPEGAVLGYRGLILACIRLGDWIEAERYVDTLARSYPKTPWLDVVRSELAIRRKQWGQAEAALSRAASARLVDSAKAKRHRAALLVAESESAALRGDSSLAVQSAEKATRFAPDWLPALLNLAVQQKRAQHKGAAARTIERAFAAMPHLQLAELYLTLEPDEDPLRAHRRLEKLARRHREHEAVHLALAQSALAADLWGEARRHLTALVQAGQATQKIYGLLAQLERREKGDLLAAERWLGRAAQALPDPRWICSSCGSWHDAWQPVCSQCGAFNALEWQTPGSAGVCGPASSGRTGLLAALE